MTTVEIVQFIKDVGVPVAMLAWFALRMEKKVDAMTESNNKVTASIDKNTEATNRTTDALQRVADALQRLDERNTPPLGIPAIVVPSGGKP